MSSITTPIMYVIDFLNQFSDVREMKYKKQNVDFHKVKHINKEKDTIEFFDLFFGSYINYVKINKNSNFIFVLKKISNYEHILYNILEKYKDINIRFIVIETKYNDNILDKNKDDFLCQYIFNFLLSNNDNCVMISNDKYRDRNTYVNKFKNKDIKINITIIKKSKDNSSIEINNTQIQTDIIICDNILTQKYKRVVIPKHNLHSIL